MWDFVIFLAKNVGMKYKGEDMRLPFVFHQEMICIAIFMNYADPEDQFMRS